MNTVLPVFSAGSATLRVISCYDYDCEHEHEHDYDYDYDYDYEHDYEHEHEHEHELGEMPEGISQGRKWGRENRAEGSARQG